jgi:hypothetical protein
VSRVYVDDRNGGVLRGGAAALPAGGGLMNGVLWAVQAVLALLYLAGGAYKTFMFDALATQLQVLPRVAWGVLGGIEMVGAVLLIAPAALQWKPGLTPLAAIVLTVETLGLAALYASYSIAFTAENPLVWAAAMAALVGFVAYGRSGTLRQP